MKTFLAVFAAILAAAAVLGFIMRWNRILEAEKTRAVEMAAEANRMEDLAYGWKNMFDRGETTRAKAVKQINEVADTIELNIRICKDEAVRTQLTRQLAEIRAMAAEIERRPLP